MMDLRKWLAIVRIWSFPLNFVSVSVGVALALPHFDLGFYIAMVVGVMALNGVANVVNDIYDFEYGTDRNGDRAAEMRGHPLLTKSATKHALWNATLVLSVVAALCGAYIAFRMGYIILILGAVGALFAFVYTMGRKSIKALGLGELAVFAVYGPIVVESAFFVESGTFSLIPAVVSLPIGILVMLVLVANNTRDMKEDMRVGIRNIVIALGRDGAVSMFSGMLAASYALVLVFIALGDVPATSAMVLLSVPAAVRMHGMMHGHLPHDAAAKMSGFALTFGVLFVLGIVAGRIL